MDEKNNSRIEDLEKKALKEKEIHPESQISKLDDIEDIIKYSEEEIKKHENELLDENNTDYEMNLKLSKISKEKEMLENVKTDKEWLIKNN